MLKGGVNKPVHEGTPWINSFVLVELKDKNTGKTQNVHLSRTQLISTKPSST